MKRLLLILVVSAFFSVSIKFVFAGDVEAKLNSADGSTNFEVQDSGGTIMSQIDSDGNMVIKGGLRLDAGGTEYTTAENLIVDGSVGIGSTGPDTLLEIENATNGNQLSLHHTGTSDGNYAGLSFKVSDNLSGTLRKGAILFERKTLYYDNILHFALDGTADSTNADLSDSKLAILTSGNVGIGTTGPNAELHIAGTTPEVRIGDDGAEDTSISFMGNAQDYYIGLDDTNDALTVGLGTAVGTTPYVTVDSSGNVGIGTTGPGGTTPTGYNAGKALEVMSASTSVDPGVFLRRSDGSVGLDLWADSSSGPVYIDSRWDSGAETGSIIFRTETSATPREVMRLSETGNVGIGTTGPRDLLEVYGHIGLDNFIRFYGSGPVIYSSGYTYPIKIDGSSVLLNTGSNGNVGIGTTGPASNLALSTTSDAQDGVAQSNYAFMIQNPADDTNQEIGIGFRISATQTSTVEPGAAITHERTGSNSKGNLHLKTKTGTGSTGTLTTHVTINDSGNVGIGTTGPTATLHVDGAAGTVSFEVKSDETTSTNNVLMLRSDVAGADDAIFRVQANGETYADGAYTGTGADYAEWFEKEGELTPRDLVGLNLATGKVRRYQSGDLLVGVYSQKPGFVGNQPLEKAEEEMRRDYALVSLIGQVDVKDEQVRVENGRVCTQDGIQLGYRVANGKVLLRM